MKNKDFLENIEAYYKEGLHLLKDEDDIGKSYFYQMMINQELKQLRDDKQINIFSYNSYKKKYTIDKRKK